MERRATFALILVTLIWGTTFSIVHQAVATFPPLALITLRFTLASVAIGPLLYQQRGGASLALGRHGVVVGVGLGALLFLGFATQTLGLALTAPARAGFITGLNVVLVPVLGTLWGLRPRAQVVAGVALAVLGLVVLTWGCQWSALGCTTAGDTLGWGWGDTLILICAFAFALHIVAVGRWGAGLPIVALNQVQLVTVALLAAAATVPQRGIDWMQPAVWLAAVFLGVVATALVFGLQLWAQRSVDPTRTALIFALEPVFAALFAWWWLGDQPTPAVWLGGLLMVGGVVVTELPVARWRAQPRQVGS